MSRLHLGQWVGESLGEWAAERFFLDRTPAGEDMQGSRVVLTAAGEAQAHELLNSGVRQVLVGEAALLDSEVIGRLVADYGSDRVGVYIPAELASVSWSLDRESNADFNCVVTQTPVPRWEVCRVDGSGTGTDALWWAEQMVAAGASSVLLSVAVGERDLVLCAEAVERLGDALWFTAMPGACLSDWVRWGQIRHLVLPAGGLPDSQLAELESLAESATMEDVA